MNDSTAVEKTCSECNEPIAKYGQSIFVEGGQYHIGCAERALWGDLEVLKLQNEIERLRAENKTMVFALVDAQLQISYMQEKFKKTGSGECCIARISNILDGHPLLDNSQPEQQDIKRPPASREKS